MKRNIVKMSCNGGFTQDVMLNSFQHLYLNQPSFKAEEALNKGSFRAPLRFGFTLIELLVVVLIIGILAAVAVPQYQKAVEKSRWMEVLKTVKSVGQAIDSYYLANGTYPTNWDEMDIVIGTKINTQWRETDKFKYKLNGQEGVLGVTKDTSSWKMNIVYDAKYHYLYCKLNFLSTEAIERQICDQWSNKCQIPVNTSNSGSANCGGSYRCCKILL